MVNANKIKVSVLCWKLLSYKEEETIYLGNHSKINSQVLIQTFLKQTKIYQLNALSEVFQGDTK